MAWVKAEYAGELAVVAAWIGALVPWSLTLKLGLPVDSILFAVRWPLGELQVRMFADVRLDGELVPVLVELRELFPGVHLFGTFYVATPVGATTHYGNPWLFYGGLAWLVGAAAILVAVAFSLALYLNEDGVAARVPVDHVRLMAGLLGVAAVAFALASVCYWLGPDYVGVPIPVGVLVLGALAVVLARVERV